MSSTEKNEEFETVSLGKEHISEFSQESHTTYLRQPQLY